MRSTANTVPEHTLGQEVVRKRKRVVRKTKVVRREKVARTVAARVVRAPPPRVARDLIFVEIPRHRVRNHRLYEASVQHNTSAARLLPSSPAPTFSMFIALSAHSQDLTLGDHAHILYAALEA